MRNITLLYNKSKVTGYYLDKKTQQKEDIEIPAENYFDSSSYPMMTRFLPLKKILPQSFLFSIIIHG
ncbi:hypothetical protein [Chryseobacterium sp. SIMBA_028]|uniref:DUF3108 domain-containing protein n=1 Tax=Chryseobacterium sp. SIMBA_028 TaxID=3085771 RepID=UPI00397DFC76